MTVPEKEDDKLQNLHPEAVLLTAELLGNLSALHMPFNVQNLIGNWLTLIGQAILVFNAQQQLREMEWVNVIARTQHRYRKLRLITLHVGIQKR